MNLFSFQHRWLVLVTAFAVCGRLNAAVYYVDFDGGKNTDPGTSPTTAWKHSPGDPNATGIPAATLLNPGDTVKFKGGVRYRGNVMIGRSGSDGNPITFDGNTANDWGTGKAIMDGSMPLTTSWNRCSSAADARGNPNWANIYWTTVPAGVSNGWPQLLYNGTNQTHTAQHPNPTNRFLFDIVTSWTPMSPGQVTGGTITDTANFTQTSSTYWNEAWIGIWVSGNASVFRPITSFNPSTDTVSFSPSIIPYTDRTSYYSLFNHPALIDQPGEHAVSVSEDRLYLWPPGGMHPTNFTWTIGQRPWAFGASAKHNLVIQGFLITGYFSTVGQPGYNSAVALNPSSYNLVECRNNILRNNEIKFIKCMDRDWLITMNAGNNVTISNNTVAYSFGGGVYCGGNNVLVSSNVFTYLTGTAVYMPGSTNSRISWNVVDTLLGTHANGLTIYSQASDCEVSYNRIRNVFTPITYERSRNLTFINNLVDAAGQDQRINDWGGCSGSIKWLNNTLVNNPAHNILNIGVSQDSVVYTVQNNIIDGGGMGVGATGVSSHNVYVGLHWWQKSSYGWNLGPSDQQRTAGELFASPGSDWNLKAGSPAIDAGASLTGVPNVDLNGVSRSGAFDVGAFEFGTGLRPTIAPPSDLRIP